MLIPYPTLIRKHNLRVTGILHIGACRLEEKGWYNSEGISDDKIVWIEANSDIAASEQRKHRTAKIISCAIGNEDKDDVILHVSNNEQSSSILDLETHKRAHPHVHYTRDLVTRMRRIKTLVDDGEFQVDGLNFLNMDVQGYELEVLKSFDDLLTGFSYIYTEVNRDELYKNCARLHELDEFLKDKGFTRIDMVMLDGPGWGDALYVRM